jgi:DNA-binding MarR family transcriptional regulator
MEPHKDVLRTAATSFGWTWYRMRRLIDAHLAARGASMARLKLLAFLAEKPRRSTDIVSFFDQAPRTVTQAIDALEQSGMVVRLPVPGDRRAKLVQITESGMAMLEESMPLYDAIVAQTFGSLTAEELAGLDAAIAHLNRIVDGLEEDTGFRQAAGDTRAVKSGG